jgi:ATP-dependent Lon protease
VQFLLLKSAVFGLVFNLKLEKEYMKEVNDIATTNFLPVLPLKNLVALPKSVIPIVVGREMSVKAVESALQANKEVFVTAQRSSTIDNPMPADIYHVGTRAIILQVARLPNGNLKLLVEGLSRAKIVEVKTTEGFMAVLSQDMIPLPIFDEAENEALIRNLHDLFKEYVHLNEKVSADLLALFDNATDLDQIADTVALQVHLTFEERQQYLELVDLKERTLKLCVFLNKEITILKTEKSIRKRVQSQVEKHQKDYYLTEQMRAIQRELGREDLQQELSEMRKKITKLKLSSEAAEKVEAELRKLEQMPPNSPESAVSRNFIDWLFAVPWDQEAKDTVSLVQAEKILNSSHASMKKPKERVIEFLAARKFAGKNLKRSPIICLAGPPGVGKTSLAQSIAVALGRPMVRISLGGLRDEAEIRGHRRTYIGAMPGKIIQAIKKAKVINPVIVLDEIDKMAMDFRGDPASALLEVLDPEQNKAFVDHFLEVDYDLSKVMFITTANVVDSVPYPLLDRMEIIGLSGYTDKEKLDIAKQFLLPKLFSEYSLEASQLKMDDTVLKKVISEYTKEAGVRQLERVLSKILRKSIQELLKDKKLKQVVVNEANVEKWLGVPIYRLDEKRREDVIGLATGLAWTEVGGDVLEVEVTVMKGKGALTLTGQLGEVMQESAQAALSYIRSKAKDFGLKDTFYSDVDIHIHVPEGAIPKDGPSAGVTMATAIVSALTQTPIKHIVAMTGEITLRGRVLAVGGLKEKLLAATRMGIKLVVVPKPNDKDIKEFEKELDPSLKIVYADTIDTVIENAFEKKPFALQESSKKIKGKTQKKKAKK